MLLFIVIGLGILGWIVSYRLKSKFRKYAETPLRAGLSGAEAAVQMLRDYGIYDVSVQCVEGELTDHYNPVNKTVNLSYDVYHGRNAAAVAVAAHECGHAVQHATAYSMLEFRSMMVPIQNISATILNIIFLLSLFGGLIYLALPVNMVLTIIIGCYAVITLFSLVTLPVELDASRRALAWVENRGI
ncbi:MAG: zinc metallopeptidase, partial [Flammeovirgaceae bacterium]|nr:zinc metallopeptidase [Flammeovirgaceae bacterium]MDW8286815.1 zinc metallopeptidase [Flammeovirgaceae bacterium]